MTSNVKLSKVWMNLDSYLVLEKCVSYGMDQNQAIACHYYKIIGYVNWS